MEIIIKRLVTGQWQENCYCVSNKKNSCLLVDPGADCLQIKNYIHSSGLTLKAILHTHGHFDHMGASSELKEIFNVPTYLHHADKKQLKYAALYKKTFNDQNRFIAPEIDFDLAGIEDVIIDDFSLKVIETPGHTEGSVCFYLSGNLFTGDTLMHGCIGRTDLLGGNLLKLRKSLNKLSLLPSDVIIYPGHGEISPLSHELTNNKDLREALHGSSH